jgi:hypothetical protein
MPGVQAILSAFCLSFEAEEKIWFIGNIGFSFEGKIPLTHT